MQSYTENCIPEESLPPRAGLKVIRSTDPYYGLDAEEIQDRIEFIRCYLLKDFEVLLLIPKQEYNEEFFVTDITTTDPQYSAFNTVDFQNRCKPFDKYGYAMKKIMERVRDLAIMHSSISNPVDRAMVAQRVENFLDINFRDRLAESIVEYKNNWSIGKRSTLRRKIADLNRRILEARKIWARYAPPENWDR
jgi:hypothetical protein